MLYPYIVVDNSNDNIVETLPGLERFSNFYCVGVTATGEQALNMILEKQPKVVFFNIESYNAKNPVLLPLVDQLHRYLDVLPYFVVFADTSKYAYDCIKAGVFDYLLMPLQQPDFIKCLLRIQKQDAVVRESSTGNIAAQVPQVSESFPLTLPEKQSLQMCIKSYGDYQFISLDDVVYLKADNNTTDFYMQSGRKLTAYKTLKHYENSLPDNFYRVHNSYIVNSKFITRISTGKSLCYLNGNDISVSFSKTYKENIDILIKNISTDYL